MEGGAPFGNSEKIKLATPFWKTQKMCEVDCPQALLKIFKLPLPLPCPSRCVMLADPVPCVCGAVWWCLGGACASLVALCVLCCAFVCACAHALPLPPVFAV